MSKLNIAIDNALYGVAGEFGVNDNGDFTIDGRKIAWEDETINKLATIESVIPREVSETNELADKAFVNSTAITMIANLVTFNAQREPFPTNTALMTATVFYNQGIEYTPTRNDYANVSADEAAPDPKYIGGQTRYRYDGTQ